MTPAALEQAEAECAADAPERAARRGEAAVLRQAEDRDLVRAVMDALLKLYPSCPPAEAQAIAEHTAQRGSGRVGRSAAAPGARPQGPGSGLRGPRSPPAHQLRRAADAGRRALRCARPGAGPDGPCVGRLGFRSTPLKPTGGINHKGRKERKTSREWMCFFVTSAFFAVHRSGRGAWPAQPPRASKAPLDLAGMTPV